jgi:hypothetical protein
MREQQDEHRQRQTKLETCDVPHNFHGLKCGLPSGHPGAHRAVVSAMWETSDGGMALSATRVG